MPGGHRGADRSTCISCGRLNPQAGKGPFNGVLVGVGLLFYGLWVGGTALGTVVGDLFDPEAIGLDAAFAALFLALLAPYLRSRRALATALAAAAITLVLLPFAPPGVPIVAASLAALIGLRR